MMMLSTHPSTGGPFSVVPSPFNCVSNVGFADLDLEVQNALHAFVFKGDLFDPVAVPGDAVSFVELAPEARKRLTGFVFKDDAFEKLSRNVQIDLLRFVFNDESPCDWSEDGVGVLHWVLLKDLVSLHDPDTPLADKFELLRWVFTDSELDDNPFSFANCVKVVGCSPHSPTAFFGAIDIDDVRNWLRRKAKAWFWASIESYPEPVREQIVTNTDYVEMELRRNPQWLNEQLRRHWERGDLYGNGSSARALSNFSKE
jgi:hypothetical protein